MSTAVRRVPQTMPETIDTITASVVQGALENIAVEMGYKLMRMSYSSIIRESPRISAPRSVDAEGRGLAESAQSTPLQSGPIPGYIRGILKSWRHEETTFAARRRASCTTTPMAARATAPMSPSRCRCSTTARWSRFCGDDGASPRHRRADARQLRHRRCDRRLRRGAAVQGDQGLRPRRHRNDAVWQILRDNIRVSDLVVGDMEAQIAAARIGAERLPRADRALRLSAVHRRVRSGDGLRRAADAAGDRGAAGRRLRAETKIDGYLDSPDPTKRHLPIVATVQVRGDEIEVDLTGTAPTSFPTGRSTCRSRAPSTSRCG